MQSRQFPKSLLTAILTLWMAASALSAFAQQHVSNPFVGATQYVNPDYAAEVQAVIAQTTDQNLANQMKVVATYPTAVWMDHIGAIAGGGGRLSLTQHLDTALTQEQGTTPIVVTLVIYDLPGRDCAARASNGELSINPTTTQTLPGLTIYETQYIDVIASTLNNPKYANIRFVLVIEPDSLPNLVTNTGASFTIANCQLAQSSGVYVQGIQHAINAFHPISNAYLYLDIGHSAWLGWPNNASGAVTLFTSVVSGATAGLNSIDGFIDDTANYTPLKEPFINASQTFNGTQLISANFYSFNPTVDEAGFVTEIQGLFRANGWPVSSTNFITDTSRNGWGGPNRPTAASTSTDVNTFVNASKIDHRNHRGQWCNQSGAGLGVPPLAAPPDFPQFQAYVWIKPPGESDGTYPGSANQQGAVHADPNCDPAQTNPLAGNTLTGSIANSPPAGQFFAAEFIQNIQNAFPPVPATTAPSFTVSANGTSVEQGATATTSITVLPVNGFSSTVNLSVSGLPTGVTAAFNPASITGGKGISTLTFTAAANAAVPSTPVTVTVTGGSGALTETTTISLTIVGRPDFSVTAVTQAVTLTPGSNPTATVSVAALFGFTGSVSMSAANLPAGVSANFSPSSVNGSGTITVNFNGQTSTPTGTTNISIVGTSGTLTHSATIAFTVTGSSSFKLAATNASVAQGGTATSAITVTPSGGFTGSVALSVSGLPNGVTASFNPTSASITTATPATSTLTFTASAAATAGATTVTVTGSSGNAQSSTTLTLTVTTQPDFSLSANPTTVSVVQGGVAASSTITVTPLSGFTGTVALAASGLPTGVTASFSPTSTTGTSTVTFTASSTATLGAATITVTGTSGTLSHSTTIALTVTNNQPSFKLTAAPAALTLAQGGSGSSTITVVPVNGFTGTVTFGAVSGLPAGVTASISPASTTTTSTVTFTASSTATAGTTNVTITGTSGALSASVTIALTVGTGNGGVTLATVINSNGGFFDDEGVKLSNTAAITALSITINVQNTGGLSFSGQYNTVGGSIVDTHSSTAAVITYQYTLSAGQTLSPGSGFLFDAQMGGTGTAHPTTGDTFTVTYTTGGQTFTQTGHF
ncbi:MAG TPA: glycoside hydrolase family 6 protein [Candidatus Angelobacter sp.]|nr:glycoside hydrolase family 6 protein [Candidatus Angelobacter sp.]